MRVFDLLLSPTSRRVAAAVAAVMALTTLSVVTAPGASATHMDSTTLTIGDASAGATTTYSFGWSHGYGNGTVAVGGRIELQFPSGIDVSGASLASGAIGGTAFDADLSISGQTVTLGAIDQAIVDGASIALELGGISNPTAPTSGNVFVSVFGPMMFVMSHGWFPAVISNGPLATFEVADAVGAPIGDQDAGQPFDVRIRALDAHGNLVDGTNSGPSFTGTVDLTASTDGSSGLGATPAFAGGELLHSVTLTGAADAVVLTATETGGSMTGASAPFAVLAGPADHLAVVAVPARSTPGQPLSPAPVVEVRDEFGNVIDTATGTIRAELVGTGGATLGGTVEVDAVAGVATFDDLRIDGEGEGLTLRFTYVPGGLVDADVVDSDPFDVLAAQSDPPPADTDTPPAPPAAAPSPSPVPDRAPAPLAMTGPARIPSLLLVGSMLLVAGLVARLAAARIRPRPVV